MTTKQRMMIAGVTLVAVSALASIGGPTYAEGFLGDELPDTVKKIGVAIGKGGTGAAESAAAAKKIEETADMMHLYRQRSKGGMGWGSKKDANPANDGLEKKIQELAKAVPANFLKDPTNNKEAVNWMKALAEITLAKVPTKDSAGGKTKKAWIEYTEKLKSANADLEKAITAGKTADISKAAAKINTACVDCHSKFKD